MVDFALTESQKELKEMVLFIMFITTTEKLITEVINLK